MKESTHKKTKIMSSIYVVRCLTPPHLERKWSHKRQLLDMMNARFQDFMEPPQVWQSICLVYSHLANHKVHMHHQKYSILISSPIIHEDGSHWVAALCRSIQLIYTDQKITYYTWEKVPIQTCCCWSKCSKETNYQIRNQKQYNNHLI